MHTPPHNNRPYKVDIGIHALERSRPVRSMKIPSTIHALEAPPRVLSFINELKTVQMDLELKSRK